MSFPAATDGLFVPVRPPETARKVTLGERSRVNIDNKWKPAATASHPSFSSAPRENHTAPALLLDPDKFAVIEEKLQLECQLLFLFLPLTPRTPLWYQLLLCSAWLQLSCLSSDSGVNVRANGECMTSLRELPKPISCSSLNLIRFHLRSCGTCVCKVAMH